MSSGEVSFGDVKYTYDVIPSEKANFDLVDHEWIYDRDARLVPPEHIRPSPIKYTYVEYLSKLHLIGVASGDMGVEKAVIGGASESELILIADGNLVVLDFTDQQDPPKAASLGFDVTSWIMVRSSRSMVVIGDTSVALWKNKHISWKNNDVGLGNLTFSELQDKNILLHAQIDYFSHGCIRVELEDGKLEYLPEK